MNYSLPLSLLIRHNLRCFIDNSIRRRRREKKVLYLYKNSSQHLLSFSSKREEPFQKWPQTPKQLLWDIWSSKASKSVVIHHNSPSKPVWISENGKAWADTEWLSHHWWRLKIQLNCHLSRTSLQSSSQSFPKWKKLAKYFFQNNENKNTTTTKHFLHMGFCFYRKLYVLPLYGLIILVEVHKVTQSSTSNLKYKAIKFDTVN